MNQYKGRLLRKTTEAEESSLRCSRGYIRRVALIDWIMREKDHCKTAYEAEKNGSHLAPEYIKGSGTTGDTWGPA